MRMVILVRLRLLQKDRTPLFARRIRRGEKTRHGTLFAPTPLKGVCKTSLRKTGLNLRRMSKAIKRGTDRLRQTVFVVDDEAGYTDIMRDVLEQYGLEVHISNGAFEAVQMLSWMTPDLILLDIMMPSVDGITLLRHLRGDQNKPNVPILVVSAYPETREEALAAGADGYLAKPFTAHELRSTIGQYLEVASPA